MTDETQETVIPPPPTPGYKTTEFWLGVLAMLITAMYASGAVTDNTALSIAGIVSTILGALGYTVGRSVVKRVAG